MRSFKRLLVLIIALALAAAVVFFVLENRTPTQLMFLDWQTPQLPLALFVMARSFLGGHNSAYACAVISKRSNLKLVSKRLRP